MDNLYFTTTLISLLCVIDLLLLGYLIATPFSPYLRNFGAVSYLRCIVGIVIASTFLISYLG